MNYLGSYISKDGMTERKSTGLIRTAYKWNVPKLDLYKWNIHCPLWFWKMENKSKALKLMKWVLRCRFRIILWIWWKLRLSNAEITQSTVIHTKYEINTKRECNWLRTYSVCRKRDSYGGIFQFFLGGWGGQETCWIEINGAGNTLHELIWLSKDRKFAHASFSKCGQTLKLQDCWLFTNFFLRLCINILSLVSLHSHHILLFKLLYVYTVTCFVRRTW